MDDKAEAEQKFAVEKYHLGVILFIFTVSCIREVSGEIFNYKMSFPLET